MYLTSYITCVSHVAHPNARRIVNKILREICVNEVDRIHSHGGSWQQRDAPCVLISLHENLIKILI
jgi:hypothetical protein